MFSDQNGIKLEINNKKITKKHLETKQNPSKQSLSQRKISRAIKNAFS